MNQLLSAALQYAGLGWRVFPLHVVSHDGKCSCMRAHLCNRPGKHPRTPHGVNDASSDEEKVRGWWRRWPDSNIGLATGAASATVLDIDGDAGMASVDELATGLLPVTPQVITGHGRHFYFAHVKEARNRVRLAPGLDLRNDGGYVIAPPSIHVTGQVYEWILRKMGRRPR